MVTRATIQGSFHPVTNPGFSSSRSSCWRQGSSSLSLHGLRVLAAPAQAERHHPEVHRILLPPLPHGKLVNSQVHFQPLSRTSLRMLFPRRSSSHLCFLVVFLSLRLSPHTKQSPHLPPPSRAALHYLMGCGCLEPVCTATVLSGSQRRGHNCALIVTHWTAPIGCAVATSNALPPSCPHTPGERLAKQHH